MDVKAHFIDDKRDEILEKWAEACRQRVSAARDANSLALVNRLPLVLDDIQAAILDDSVDQKGRLAGEKSFNNAHSREHGRQRATVSGYTSQQIIQEYLILKHVITDMVKEMQLPSYVNCIEAINTVIDLNIMGAVEEFNHAMEEVQSTLLGTLAHDIRTPLTVATTALYLIDDENTPEDELDDVRSMAIHSVQRATNLLGGLLDTLAIEAGDGIMMKFESGDYVQIFSDACNDAQQVYSRIEYEAPSEAIEGVFDPSAISRIIENLVSNAIRYGAVGKRIFLTLKQDDDSVVLTVNNLGNPIPKDRQEQIFDFVSSDYQTQQTKNSWSMGLTFVKLAVEAHEGEVGIDSDEEEGTTFTIRLPLKAKEPGKERTKMLS